MAERVERDPNTTGGAYEQAGVAAVSTHPGRLASAVTELLVLREGICRRMATLEAERRASVRELTALEVTLRLLDPNVLLDGERGMVVRDSGVGAVLELRGLTASVMKALRLASDPLTINDITRIIMTDRGGELENRCLRSIIRQRVGVCLRKMNIRGVVRRLGEHSNPRWIVAAEES